MSAESTLTIETQERVGLPGVLTEANRITGGTSSIQRQLEHLTPEITRWQKANLRILLTEAKTTRHHQNTVCPLQRVLDAPTHPKKQDSDLKSYLMMLVEDFLLVCLFVLFFETAFLCIALAVLELCRPGWPRTQKSACLCLRSAGIKDVRHRAWLLFVCFYIYFEPGFYYVAQAGLS